MVGDLSFITSQKKSVLYLPAKYIRSKNGKKFVYLKINDQPVKTDIKTGMEANDLTEITSGLTEGNRVYLAE
ncbi:hypothetical protein A2W14_00475 [Candidatus Gottesmanbacteria bacterium RBG_16_37_8]|uniref:CzcB-like C-terminal circularly permuted SH3-like domain-containing protein n=1 Tax=Candidatus Gottesmanbacteria bacterium RBG_16_37_8 TaxID=1798371 RepID=A0A1F5YQB8_9BACT|nr:MAG: hypothetical protein A2W14_00475 [Candidatus Gottesmanbacteria bacterium RBG_16_37_8]